MEEQIIDLFNEDQQSNGVIYATFWKRVGATLLDSLILAPFGYGLIFLSMVYYKIYALALLAALIHVVYKVYMEKTYGHTLGKKALKITVVNNAFQPITFSKTLKRNYYYILAAILSLLTTMNLFNLEEFHAASTYTELQEVMQMQSPTYRYVQYTLSVLFFIDILFMLKNDQKKTLHDRWGETLVIQK